MLTSFIAIPDVRARLKTLRPSFPRRISVPLKVRARTKHFMIVGTAFDYLLRFELQRRAPHASVSRLVAEDAPAVIWNKQGTRQTWIDLPGAVLDDLTDPGKASREMAARAQIVVEQARAAIAAFLPNHAPGESDVAELAAHAIRLAKLDDLYRASRFDPTFAEADPDDIRDLVALLAAAPFDALFHSEIILLNPTFGDSSVLVGGADADLITGDLLIDFKTRMDAKIEAEDLDQLLGYFLLARRQTHTDSTFPAVRRVGIYFCRHGHLWTADANNWLRHPQFPETEDWFFARARELYEGKRQRVSRLRRALAARS
jgi:hypothetical protein